MGRPRTPRGRALRIDPLLEELYPGDAASLCALDFSSPFQLLAATILSAQCTDVRVNAVTPVLFRSYGTPVLLAAASPARIESIIHSTGFFRAKTANLIAMATAVVTTFDGEVPTSLEELVTLPGVGRKTANVVRSVAFGLPGLPVDTHVGRLSRRMGLTIQEEPVKVEHELNALIAPERRGAFSLRMILHGRAVCPARSPRCEHCLLIEVCPRIGVL